MDSRNDLRHHGILGQRWGNRNGPPYPLGGGDYSQAERKAIYKKRKQPNSIYNKKHFDEVLRADKTTLSTLSYDRDRTKDTDMFYATHNVLDKHQYNAQSYFVSDKYKFKGYREARDVLKRMRNDDYVPTADELQKVYRMFNYVIPYDGQGDARKGKDAYTQRTKFFNACKQAGYGAVLDTNDAIYGGFKAKSPVIVFDMESVVPKDVYRTKTSEQRFSQMVLVGRKALGL